MKITGVNIPKSLNNNGIEDIKMYKLGQVVLIAGKNGSGKTRLLNKVISVFDLKPKKHQVEASQSLFPEINNQINVAQQAVDACQIQIDTYQDQSNSSFDFLRNSILKNMTSTTQNLYRLKNQRDEAQKILDWNLIETNKFAERYVTTPFVPKTLDLQDSSQMNKQSLINAFNSFNLPVSVILVGIQQLAFGTFATIQYVQNRFFDATHPDFPVNDEKREQATKEYEKLKESVEIFLNTTIGRNDNGDATLFGFPLGQANLSDGQKILLQFCIAIYHQKTALEDLILIMDEPENHLHPSVIVETIDRISKYVKNGQIWIATHSIPLLAHFDSNSIWYMDNGSISHAGNIPERVLESLLGDEEEIAKLQDFVGLPAQLALNRFAYECLFEPQVVLTGKEDPQILQIRNELGKFEKEGKIKLLDYGAGKGRLLANIAENSGNNLQSFTDQFDYIAFDKFDSDKEDCKKLLEKVYGTSLNKYFNDFATLLSYHDKKSFDIVIMSNVLHEIDSKNWLKLFSEGGQLTSLLSEIGVLLLVEDTQVPVGEKAYQNGFIVLDTPQLKELFEMSKDEFTFSEERNGRLKCHVIPKNCLSRINPDSRKLALTSLREISKEKIIQIRKADKDYRNGKLHGYWVQQLANTTLALWELTNE